eukprot:SM006010S19571  [mRNA]  locus=s6010:395:800:- [translate_table: standard]
MPLRPSCARAFETGLRTGVPTSRWGNCWPPAATM